MEQIKGNQIPKYDAISREIEKAIRILESISLAGINADASKKLVTLISDLRAARAEFFTTAHAAFIRARFGEGSDA